MEPDALDRAEAECLGDSEARERRRLRETIRRDEEDKEYVERFAARVRELYPRCPAAREREIAEHACLKYSGRVGRAAFAKTLDEEAVRLAVIAHVRHRETRYDGFLAKGFDRWEAREAVEEIVHEVLRQWELAS